jgi:hypothetical protein
VEVRKLNSEDYESTLKGWWKDWGWAAPTRDFLPENGEGGFLVYSGEAVICAGFAYITNSKTGWSEFIISNKQYRGDDRNDALDLLMETITMFLKGMGCKYIFTSVKSQSLIDRYKKHGYLENDKSVEMLKIL